MFNHRTCIRALALALLVLTPSAFAQDKLMPRVKSA